MSSELVAALRQALGPRVQAKTLETLLAALSPGTVLTGRVVENLGQDLALIALRGRLVVAQTPMPLAADTLVRLVASGQTDDGTPQVRIDAAPLRDDQATSTPDERLARINLPVTPSTRAALALVESAGAPLQTSIISDTAQALETGDLPKAQALVRLWQIGLPPTPALIQAAKDAQNESLPKAAALLVPQESSPDILSATPGKPEQSAPQTPLSTRAPSVTPTVPVESKLAQAEIPRPLETPVQMVATPTAIAKALPQSSEQTIQNPLVFAEKSAHNLLLKTAQPQPILVTPTVSLEQQGVLEQQTTPASGQTTNAPPAVKIPLPVELLQQKSVVLTPKLSTADADAPAVIRQALELAGVQAREETPETRADHQNVKHAPEEHQAQQNPTTLASLLARNLDTVNAPTPERVRETFAQTLVPPDSLAEYDQVIPLALTYQGQPLPARIAVAERTSTSGDSANFVRVDVELGTLGQLSIRLSAARSGGPLSLTIFAPENVQSDLSGAMKDLISDLEALSIPTHARISTLDVQGLDGGR